MLEIIDAEENGDVPRVIFPPSPITFVRPVMYYLRLVQEERREREIRE